MVWKYHVCSVAVGDIGFNISSTLITEQTLIFEMFMGTGSSLICLKPSWQFYNYEARSV